MRPRRPRRRKLLSPLQEQTLEAFAQLPDAHRFYLTGGTALAEFYLGHRYSFDLDLFTGEPGLLRPFSHALEQHLRASGIAVRVVRRLDSFVELVVSGGAEELQVQLALDSPFRLEPAVSTTLGVLVNDYVDLAVDKLLAFFGRAEPRDAVDLFFILKHESLDPLLELAARKDPGFDLYWFARALLRVSSFPPEIERWPVELRKPVSAPALQRRFRRLAQDLMERIHPG